MAECPLAQNLTAYIFHIVNRPPPAPQNLISKMLRDAASAWQRQDYQCSFDILERASRLSPDDPCILLELGSMHGQRCDFAAAEKYFEKAIRVSGWRAEAYLAAGLHCLNFRNDEMAERYLNRAIERENNPGVTLMKLARIYEIQRRPEKAAELVARVLKSNPSNAAALFVQARSERRAGRLENAEKLARLFLSKPGADVEWRARGWYELGGILDSQKRYDEAMTSFLEAKNLLRPLVGREVVQFQRAQTQMVEMENMISTEVLHRWFDFGAQLQPARRFALLCGQPRSGTTLLEQVLDSHADIISVEESPVFKEEASRPLHRNFPEDTPVLSVLESAPADRLHQSRENYFRFAEKLLGEAVGGRLLIDKNPGLNLAIPAVVRIFPEARFLVAVRDPRDVCLSCFMQPLEINAASFAFLSLEDTVTQYAAEMGFWRAMQPRLKNPAIEIRYEDLVNDLESAARRVLDFLGVDWNERVLRFNEHARNKTVWSPTSTDVTRPIFKTAIGRWRNYQKYLEPHLEKLDPLAKALGYE
jgi:tetratricopeptide (TPR) repeat protein